MKRIVRALAAFVVIGSAALACGDITSTEDGAAVTDGAASVDAAIVACSSSEDCMAPPSPCLLPGTCDSGSGTCDFPQKDCSGLDGECASGTCDPATGDCVAAAANEDATCGEETKCEPDGVCDFGGSICSESGTQPLTCADFTCQAGECVAGDPYSQSAPCARDTAGEVCGTEQVSNCGSCSFSSTCAQQGSRSCTCTTFSCAGGVCETVSTSCLQTCTRNTNGVSCGSQQVSNCGPCQGDCSGGTQSCQCTNFTCSSGSCQSSTTTCERSCSMEGQVCGAMFCGGTAAEPKFCSTCCSGGGCSNSCCGPCI